MVLMIGRYSLTFGAVDSAATTDGWSGFWKIHYTNASTGAPLLAHRLVQAYPSQREAISQARTSGIAALDALIAGQPKPAPIEADCEALLPRAC